MICALFSTGNTCRREIQKKSNVRSHFVLRLIEISRKTDHSGIAANESVYIGGSCTALSEAVVIPSYCCTELYWCVSSTSKGLLSSVTLHIYTVEWIRWKWRSTHKHTYTHWHARMRTNMHARTHTHKDTNARARTHTYTHTHTNTHTHTHTQTHTYTHTHTPVSYTHLTLPTTVPV